jgi:outer membrane protein OmpA-like peptidoglycan-associated protein
MALSDQIQDQAIQVVSSGDDPAEPSNKSTRSLDRFFGLLSDLKIIETPAIPEMVAVEVSEPIVVWQEPEPEPQQAPVEKAPVEKAPVEKEEPAIAKTSNPEPAQTQTKIELSQFTSENVRRDLHTEAKVTAKVRDLMLTLEDVLGDELESKKPTLDLNSDIGNPLERLQGILVEPELANVRHSLSHLEAVMTLIEAKVNDPALEKKLAELENQMQDSSEMSGLQQQLAEMATQQTNIPSDIANLKQKVAKLEHQLYEPKQLINLLVPLVAEMLTLKVEESREEIVNAIAPVVDEMIQLRAFQDKEAMSKVLSDIIPNAISQEIINSPEAIAKAIAPEIGAAIKEQIRIDRDAISSALAPEMGAAIRQQIELERDAMVDALYPVIGGTISKYLAEAIRSINEKVENTFSVEGVKRKIRAKTQGVSEAELILRESIPFTIQAIFLIHKTSGLVITDVQESNQNMGEDELEIQGLDSDMVAGMLTAIRSFVNDCIVRTGDISELNEVDYGDSKIILEVAGYCYLAVVVKGEPPKQFIEKMRSTFEYLVQAHGKSIEQFDGDPDTVPTEVRSHLTGLMAIAAKAKSAKSSNALAIAGLVILSLVVIPWGYFQYRSSVDRRVESAAIAAIGSTPELAVYRLQVEANGDHLKLSGNLPNQYLRGKAESVARQSILPTIPHLKLDNAILAVNVPPDPELTNAEVQRVTKTLNQISGLEISTKYEAGKVVVNGKVSDRANGKKITQALAQIPGVQSVTNTIEVPPLQLPTKFYFDSGSATLRKSDRIKIAEINIFLRQNPEYGLKIMGSSDSTGSATRNQWLAAERAKTVRDALVKQGVKGDRLQVGRVTSEDLGQAIWLNRRVEFQPIMGKLNQEK